MNGQWPTYDASFEGFKLSKVADSQDRFKLVQKEEKKQINGKWQTTITYYDTELSFDQKARKITLYGPFNGGLEKNAEFFRNFDEITFEGKAIDSWTFRTELSHADLIIKDKGNTPGNVFMIGGWTTYAHAKNIKIETDADNSAAIGFYSGNDHGVITAKSLTLDHQGKGEVYGILAGAGKPVNAFKPSGERSLTFEKTNIALHNGGTAVVAGSFKNGSPANDGEKNKFPYEGTLDSFSDITVSLGDAFVNLEGSNENTSYGIRSVNSGNVIVNDLQLTSSTDNSYGIHAAELRKTGDETTGPAAKVEVKGDVFIDMKGNGSTAVFAGKEGQILLNAENKTRDTVINGDIRAVDGGEITIGAMSSGSVLTSNISTDDSGVVDLTLGNGASWNVKGDSNVSTLNIQGENTRVFLNHESYHYNTLVIDELSGDKAATFVLHSELKGKGVDGANDRVIVKSSASGTHALHIPSSGDASDQQNSSYLIYAPSTVDIKLEEKNHPNQMVDKGLYMYTLAKEEVQDPTATANILTRDVAPTYNGYYLTLADQSNPNPGEDNPGSDTPDVPKPVVPILSPTAKAVLAMAGMGGQNAMFHNQLSDLRKRLGEVRGYDQTAGLWTSVSGQKDRFDGFESNGVKQNAYRFNLGLDYKLGDWLVGGNFKYLRATQKTTESDSHAKGRVNSAGFNLYGTWMNDVGCYADIVASFDHYHQKITTSMLDGTGVKGKVNNIGLGLSAEIGKKFELAHDFFVEPQVQLAYYWIKGKDFEMSNGMKVKQENFNSLNGRLGVVVGKDFKDSAGNRKGQVHFRGGVKQQLVGNQKIYANTVKFEDDLKGTSGYYGLGFEATPNKKFRVYGHIERENGKHYTKEVEVMVGLRYRF